jgi:hypothetical protein
VALLSLVLIDGYATVAEVSDSWFTRTFGMFTLELPENDGMVCGRVEAI